jgi:hypothetical protein
MAASSTVMESNIQTRDKWSSADDQGLGTMGPVTTHELENATGDTHLDNTGTSGQAPEVMKANEDTSGNKADSGREKQLKVLRSYPLVCVFLPAARRVIPCPVPRLVCVLSTSFSLRGHPLPYVVFLALTGNWYLDLLLPRCPRCEDATTGSSSSSNVALVCLLVWSQYPWAVMCRGTLFPWTGPGFVLAVASLLASY